MSNNFTVHTLGCGSAKPTLRHQPSSTVLDHRGRLFMVDCGEGAQQSFQRHRLKLSRLSDVFLTHLHGDHVFGLPGLVGTLGLMNTGGSLRIHTFAEGREILSRIFDFFCRDLSFDVVFNILDPQKEEIAYEDKSLIVRTIPLHHRVPAVGYVFEEKPGPRHILRDMIDFHGVPVYKINEIKEGADFLRADGRLIKNDLLTSPPTPPRRYAHISDTAYMPDIAGKIGPVDLLFHETTYLDSEEKEAAARGHSTARQAAMVARDAGASRLLTGHYSSRYKDESLFQSQAAEVFKGPVLLNSESLSVDL